MRLTTCLCTRVVWIFVKDKSVLIDPFVICLCTFSYQLDEGDRLDPRCLSWWSGFFAGHFLAWAFLGLCSWYVGAHCLFALSWMGVGSGWSYFGLGNSIFRDDVDVEANFRCYSAATRCSTAVPAFDQGCTFWLSWLSWACPVASRYFAGLVCPVCGLPRGSLHCGCLHLTVFRLRSTCSRNTRRRVHRSHKRAWLWDESPRVCALELLVCASWTSNMCTLTFWFGAIGVTAHKPWSIKSRWLTWCLCVWIPGEMTDLMAVPGGWFANGLSVSSLKCPCAVEYEVFFFVSTAVGSTVSLPCIKSGGASGVVGGDGFDT